MKKHIEWCKWVPVIQNCMHHTYHDITEFVPYKLYLNQKVVHFWEKYFRIHKVDKMAHEQNVFLAAKRTKKKLEEEEVILIIIEIY